MTAALIAGECLRKELVPPAAIRWILAERTIVLDARHEFCLLGWTESLARWHRRFSNRGAAFDCEMKRRRHEARLWKAARCIILKGNQVRETVELP
jgi:hypothetical protein